MRSITLQEYANRKKSSVEDIIAHWRKQGLMLDGGAAHVLTPGELKIMDPVLWFNLRKEEKQAPKKHLKQNILFIEKLLKIQKSIAESKKAKYLRLKIGSRLAEGGEISEKNVVTSRTPTRLTL